MANSKKTTLTIAGWMITTLLSNRKDKELKIEVEHTDRTPVSEIGEDISSYNTLGYCFSSEGIEVQTQNTSDNTVEKTSCENVVLIEKPNTPIANATITIDDWSVDVVVGSDKNLSLYASSIEGNSIEHDSLTNGTSHSKACEIEIYQG